MKTLTFSFLLLLFCLLPAVAQIPDIIWEKQFELNTSYYFSDVLETTDGGFILAGAVENSPPTGSDIWLLACNSMGDTLKTRTFSIKGNDVPVKILDFKNAGYLLAFMNTTEDNSYMARLMAVDYDFNELWSKEALKASAILHTDTAVDSTGVIWWLNTFAVSEETTEVVVSKLNSDGNAVEEFLLSNNHPAEGYAIRVLPDGSLAVASKCLPGGENTSVQVVRMATDGNIIWKTAVEGNGKCLTPQCLCCSPDDALLIGGWAGLCYNPDAPVADQIWDYDYLLIKLDEAGKVVWSKNYNREGSEKGTAVAVMPDGGIMAGGKCETSFTGKVGPWLMLIDANGNMVNEQIYKFRFVKDQVARLLHTSDGGMLMVGPGYVESGIMITGWVRKLGQL